MVASQHLLRVASHHLGVSVMLESGVCQLIAVLQCDSHFDPCCCVRVVDHCTSEPPLAAGFSGAQ
jgi:hypothetical protein